METVDDRRFRRYLYFNDGCFEIILNFILFLIVCLRKICSSQKSRIVDENFDDDDEEYENLSDTVPDEAFYYNEFEAEIETDIEPNTKSPNPPSPPTLSHRDMARPPHEDPEYQRQLVGNMR